MTTQQALDEFQYLGAPVAVPTSRRHELASLSDDQWVARPDLYVRIDVLDGQNGATFDSGMSAVLVKGDEASVASAAAEAIIEEARHWQHRRWLWRAMAAAVAALVIGLALAF